MAIKQKIFYDIPRDGLILEKFIKKATGEINFKNEKCENVNIKAQPERYGVVVATSEVRGLVGCLVLNYEFSKEDFDKLKPMETVKAFLRLQNESSTKPVPSRIITGEGEVLYVTESATTEPDEEDEEENAPKKGRK